MTKLNAAPFPSKLTYALGASLDCYLGTYGNGQTALLLRDALTGEPVAKATVAVDFPPGPGLVVLKCWSENAGMVETLRSAGIIQGEIQGLIACGHAYGEVYILSEVVA